MLEGLSGLRAALATAAAGALPHLRRRLHGDVLDHLGLGGLHQGPRRGSAHPIQDVSGALERHARLLQLPQDARSRLQFVLACWKLKPAEIHQKYIKIKRFSMVSSFKRHLRIADVPFPLPYAQLLGLLLIAFSCLIPFYASRRHS